MIAAYESSRPPGRRHFHCLDGIRGVAALLIAIRHTPQFFAGPQFPQSYLAVDVFFLLSGVVICDAYEHKVLSGMRCDEFFRIRLIRIYPLYLLGTMIAVLATATENRDPLSDQLIHAVLSIVLIPNPNQYLDYYYPLNGPSWSLMLELLINLIYAYFLRRLSNRILIGVLISSAIGMIASVLISHKHDLDLGWTIRTLPAGLFRVAFSFFAGVLMRRTYSRYSTEGRDARMFLLSKSTPYLVSVAVGGLLMAPTAELGRPYFDLIAVLLMFPAIIWVALQAQPIGVLAKSFRFVGGVSYAVYAIHQPLGRLVSAVAARFEAMRLPIEAPWSGVVFMVALCAFCVGLNKYYDGPVRQSLQRISTRKRHNSDMASPATNLS